MISRQFYINSFPAMLFFGDDKKTPNEYLKDSRSPEDLIDFALEEAKKVYLISSNFIFKKI